MHFIVLQCSHSHLSRRSLAAVRFLTKVQFVPAAFVLLDPFPQRLRFFHGDNRVATLRKSFSSRIPLTSSNSFLEPGRAADRNQSFHGSRFDSLELPHRSGLIE